ncbi:MAG: GldG family protein [Acidobacteriaceae bacterium]|jgi:ABC-type uncharacterized transport system involved in gliding motility auxiliary subunit|nr:GldG family protein [Acidobacteriaceae bacterium]
MNRIFNLIGWLGTALVLAAVSVRFLRPEYETYTTYLAEGGLVCMVAYILSQGKEVLQFFKGRRAQYGTLAASSVLIVLGILVAVNYIGKRQNKRWDLTQNKQFSLSDQSRNILSKLDAPLDIKVFVQESSFQEYRDRLKEYEYNSKQVHTEYIDPDKKRAVAQQYQVQQYGTIVLEYKGRTERTTANSEQDITNTIIKAVTGETKKVYFTQGHGEKDITSQERDGYGTIADALKRENYSVDRVVLAQTNAVPADAAAVIVAGPKTDFFPPEIDALQKYLDKQGKALLLLDPQEKPDSTTLPNLVALAREWGIQVDNTIVVDASGMGRLIGTDASVPVAANYPPHPITERFTVLTAFPLARSVSPMPGSHAQPVVESSPQSWAETDIKSLLTTGQVELNEDKGDKPGPITLAVATSEPSKDAPAEGAKDAPKPETRIVVVGDSDFAANGALGVQGNKDLFMNMVSWLSQQENLISIRTKDADDRRLTLTATQQSNIVWLTLLIIPAAIFGTGIYGWWRRR